MQLKEIRSTSLVARTLCSFFIFILTLLVNMRFVEMNEQYLSGDELDSAMWDITN